LTADATTATYAGAMSPDMRRIVGVTWLPALLAVIAVTEMAALQPPSWQAGATLEVFACAALCWRRRFVVLSPMLALGAIVMIPVLGTPLSAPTMPIALCALAFFSLGRHVGDRRALWGFVVILGGVWADYRWFDSRQHNGSDLLFVLVVALLPFVLGQLMRRLSEQKAALEVNRDLVRIQAIRDERDRIARDLHDVIAHSISAMVVQTAAAQDLVRTDPDRAEAALSAVADAGRHALTDTGRLLHVLRDTEGELGLAPASGLAEVPELVDQFRANGLRIDLDFVQPSPPLPAGIDVSAYRIVQEALTNALRYGADGAASLSIACAKDAVSIRSSNVSSGSSRSLGSGLGLLGIAERIAVLGGTFSHGITPEGRFELAVTLPVTT
jgi:signal transduction histidine kinase